MIRRRPYPARPGGEGGWTAQSSHPLRYSRTRYLLAPGRLVIFMASLSSTTVWLTRGWAVPRARRATPPRVTASEMPAALRKLPGEGLPPLKAASHGVPRPPWRAALAWLPLAQPLLPSLSSEAHSCCWHKAAGFAH